ncbi:MAG TPA: hypothetical protein VJK51_01770 [Candidatus Nanoarchaeia archaeon]|nr:hypothetical protein [Candidatus Nanoarchaeia archaeon]
MSWTTEIIEFRYFLLFPHLVVQEVVVVLVGKPLNLILLRVEAVLVVLDLMKILRFATVVCLMILVFPLDIDMKELIVMEIVSLFYS